LKKSSFLEWEEIEKLVIPLAEVWSQVKDELQLFIRGKSWQREISG
jgi:hypothetical protein